MVSYPHSTLCCVAESYSGPRRTIWGTPNAAPTCNTVVLGIATSGDYVRSISCGSGITGCVASAPGATPTLAASVTGLANPSATVGFTAVNGSATTAMRSDAAPALAAIPAGMIQDMAHAQLGGM